MSGINKTLCSQLEELLHCAPVGVVALNRRLLFRIVRSSVCCVLPLQPYTLKTRRCMQLRGSDDGCSVLMDQWDTNIGPLAPPVLA